ncbi:hypothetical protein PRIC1_008538 [Phytophthora ramorum]
MALAMIASPTVRAQDAGTVTAPSPEATTAAAVVTADTAAPAATEAATAPVATTVAPVATEMATLPAAIETPAPIATDAAVATPAPSSTPPPTSTEAATVVAATASPASTDAPTTTTPATTAVPSPTSQVIPNTGATMLQDTTSSESSFRGSDAGTSASSLSSSSRGGSATTTGTLEGSSATKTTVIVVLGGVGLTIVLSLLFVAWRSRTRKDQDLNTPLPPDTGTITFPAVSLPSVAMPTAQDLSAWKASGSSFASRDLPLTESTRAKLNATTRSSTEYDLANRPSQIASLPARGTTMYTPQETRGTNASSEQSFSIRGYSEFSVLHAGDSESSAMTTDRYSTNDGYSTGDRYSTSSRLSSEPGRSNSGWFQQQVPNLDMHRFSSTSSTASSVAARQHNLVSIINHDLTRTPSAGAPVTTDSTTSRTDVPDWYSVIESPTDNDRYTTTSLDSDNISNERESFEL